MNRIAVAILAGTALLFLGRIGCMTWMPGANPSGPPPPLNAVELALAEELRGHVVALSQDIGERNTRRGSGLEAARGYVEASFSKAGWLPTREEYEIRGGAKLANVWVEAAGQKAPQEIVLVGAHYDSALGSPGADDNASGVAALLTLSGRLRAQRLDRTLRFVAFASEEPPTFHTQDMGSVAHANACRARRDDLRLAIVLDGLGYYSDAKRSQRYPSFPFNALYPSQGDFLAFIGNSASSGALRRLVGAFRGGARLPSKGAVIDGVSGEWSDQWAFWRRGYEAVLVTDTLTFRYPAYHKATDLPEQLDFARLALAVEGLEVAIRAEAARE